MYMCVYNCTLFSLIFTLLIIIHRKRKLTKKRGPDIQNYPFAHTFGNYKTSKKQSIPTSTARNNSNMVYETNGHEQNRV